MIKENWDKLKGFINEEVAPQAYKVYEAAMEANERQKAAAAREADKVKLEDE